MGIVGMMMICTTVAQFNARQRRCESGVKSGVGRAWWVLGARGVVPCPAALGGMFFLFVFWDTVGQLHAPRSTR